MGSLNLRVEIDDKSGFCFGVVGAIEKAEKELEASGELYCLGEIVHNDEEVAAVGFGGPLGRSLRLLWHVPGQQEVLRMEG